MAVKNPTDFFEPWFATKGSSHGPKPSTEGLPEGVGESILDKWHQADDNAPWVVWGSRMAEPRLCVSFLDGHPVLTDDRRIIGINRSQGLPEGSPNQQQFAERITKCVSALAGVRDPQGFVADVRSLLLSYVQGEEGGDPRSDYRVVSLLSRCIPPDQFDSLSIDEDNL